MAFTSFFMHRTALSEEVPRMACWSLVYSMRWETYEQQSVQLPTPPSTSEAQSQYYENRQKNRNMFEFHNASYLSLISTHLPLWTQNYNIPFNRTRPTNFFQRSYSCKNSENLSDLQLHESSFYPKLRNDTEEQNKHSLIFRSKTVVPCLTVSFPSSVALCLKWIKIPVADLKR